MTDSPEALDRPRISAVTNEDGTGQVTVDGTVHPVKARDAAGARKAVLTTVVLVAQEYGRPVKVAASGSDGVRQLVVSPDGTVEEAVESTVPPSDRSPQAAPPIPPVPPLPPLPPVGAVPSAAPASGDAPTAPTFAPLVTSVPKSMPAAPAAPAPAAPAPAPVEPAAPAPASRSTAAPTEPAAPAAPEPMASTPVPAAPAPAPAAAAPSPGVPAAPVAEVPPAPAAAPVPADAAASDPAAEPSLTRREARLLTARDFAETARPVGPAPATEGLRGGMNRLGFRLAPGKQEQAKRDRRETVQRAFAGRKTIAVIGEKGGVGKTTTTYLLGATLGRVRGGSVLAWDNNEFKGTLGIRSLPSPDHDHTAIDLLDHVQSVGTGQLSSPDLIDFVRAQGENKFDVLASQSLDGDSDVIDEEAFGLLHETLSRSYRVIIVDTGNNSKAGTWQSAVAAADVLVLTTIVKEDSARTLASMADTLIAHGHEEKLRNAVTVMSHPSPTSYPDLERRLTNHMGQLTRQVVSVPFDAALDRGDVIDYEALSSDSREAWLEVTAAVAEGLR
ncbi:MinD/ParA family ATP-binding protein [Microbacterium marinilacus]|uniref:Chromosome partitioning protein n=1 Tax=Microbacterium marinilacus TaxID=415209 RepID=A0ABP7BNC4_9MICO|nr:AAA family ATPase [Microbacterium marinilacus]MBY0690424.1 AAA family ATPase [Microbacterium marinilacus]